ncbi:MAG: cytochrome-c peroxidase [Chitinophagales bacterium]
MKTKLLLPATMVLLLFSCNQNAEHQNSAAAPPKSMVMNTGLIKKANEVFQPLPKVAESAENPITDAKVALGKALYYETKLSLKGNNSCNSCHNLKTYGVDNLPTSKGDNSGFGKRNSPTVLNAALHAFQFWDGRAKDVEEQAGGPILNPVEMAMHTEVDVEKRLGSDERYVQLFKAAFPNDKQPISYANLRKAIGAFERTLLTPSPFDDFLQGNSDALSTQQQAGLQDFMDAGCTTCHSGVSVGGTMFQKFGTNADYHTFTHSKATDEGRKEVTKDEADKNMFKVCGLRNVAKTQPYFHDGSVSSLQEAIKIMGKAELNKDLTDEQVKNIEAFLNSLTGEVPKSAIKEE